MDHDSLIQAARSGQRIPATRREIAKLRRNLRTERFTQKLMEPYGARPTGRKVRYPVRDETFVLETEKRTRDERRLEHPLLVYRRRLYDPKVKSNRAN